MQAKDRLRKKVTRIVEMYGDDQNRIDREVSDTLTLDEILTVGLMPIKHKLRTYIVGCLLRDTKRKKAISALEDAARKEELVPVEVHGGGKCKMTIFMTKEAAERERGRG